MSRLPNPIRWTQGMLLSPQHFQQFGARYEALAQLLPTFCARFAWGVIDHSISDLKFTEGTLVVEKLSGFTPDGLYIEVPEGYPIQVDLQPFAEASQRNPVRIHVGVPLADTADARNPAAEMKLRPSLRISFSNERTIYSAGPHRTRHSDRSRDRSGN